MIKGVYCVFDNKANVYNSPFVAHSDAEAERSFADGIKDPQTAISRNPSDYALCRIGSFNCVSGQLLDCTMPVHIANGSQFASRPVSQYNAILEALKNTDKED